MVAPAGPRIAPGGWREVGPLIWALSWVAGRVTGTRPPNLFLTLGRHRRLCRGWLRFASRLMPRGALPRRETELVILRVAHLASCPYELEHHLRMGRRVGLGAADVARVFAGPDSVDWTARERAVLSAVDALHGGDLDEPTWRELRDHLGEREVIELCMLVGHYEMLATVIGALRIEPDRELRGRAGRSRRPR